MKNYYKPYICGLEGQKIPFYRISSDGTLIIVLYRKETERLLSAIRHVMKMYCADERVPKDKELKTSIVHSGGEEDECIINEQSLVDNIISTYI